MLEIGRLCIKTAGRDAGCKCIVIDILDNKYVKIDGETRRRKCNISHLEPLNSIIKINKNASHEDVKKECKKLGFNIKETKPKEKQVKPKKIKEKVKPELKKETKSKTKHKKIKLKGSKSDSINKS